MWHFIKTEEYVAQQRLQLSNSNSLLIKHKHIKEIKYLDNNSNFQTIKFK